MVVVRAAPAPPVDPVNELRSLGHGLAILMLDGPLGRLSRARSGRPWWPGWSTT
jgi:hypothetical protein